jgi:hypothetical protein
LAQFLPARIAHEVLRVKEFAERRLRVTAPIMPGSRSKSTARGTYLPPSLVVEHVDAAEVRIAVATVKIFGKTMLPPKSAGTRN